MANSLKTTPKCHTFRSKLSLKLLGLKLARTHSKRFYFVMSLLALYEVCSFQVFHPLNNHSQMFTMRRSVIKGFRPSKQQSFVVRQNDKGSASKKLAFNAAKESLYGLSTCLLKTLQARTVFD